MNWFFYIWTGALAGLGFCVWPLMFSISIARDKRQPTLKPLLFFPVALILTAIVIVPVNYPLSVFLLVFTPFSTGPGAIAAVRIRRKAALNPEPDTPPFYHPPSEPA